MGGVNRGAARKRSGCDPVPAYFRIPLWEKDFSAVKLVLDELQAGGVSDLRSYIDAHPELVEELIAKVRIIDVNPATLRLFGARSKNELFSSLEKIFVPETRPVFLDELSRSQMEREFAGEALLRTLEGEQRSHPIGLRCC